MTEPGNYTWQDVHTLLLQWLDDPAQLADDGIDAPSSEIILSAIDYANDAVGDIGPPTSVTPTPEGNIAFEWRHGSDVDIIEIVGVGVAEHVLIWDGIRSSRRVIDRAQDGWWRRREPRRGCRTMWPVLLFCVAAWAAIGYVLWRVL